MRISYWSADVCSSDLAALQSRLDGERSEQDRRRAGDGDRPVADRGEEAVVVGDRGEAEFRQRIEMLAQPVDGLADAVEAEGTVEQGRNQRGVLRPLGHDGEAHDLCRSEEHTSELQSLMRISYAVFCLKKKKKQNTHQHKAT